MERVVRKSRSRPNEEDLLFKGKNIHCRKEPLFEREGDSFVYRGYFKRAEDSKEEIAVRKIKKTDCCDKWEDIFNKHTQEDSIKHENVLKIISYEEMDEWRFFALEHYDATLEQFCKGFYRRPMPSDAQVLCQITKGLLYLHAEKCIHGNLTPRTILIASSQAVHKMIKLSEFGLCKFSDQCDDSLAESNDEHGNDEHRAAKRLKYTEELWKPQDICQRKYWILDGTSENNQTPTSIDYNQDIFSAGCISFYFLKRGVHPFGYSSTSILENIKKRNPVNLKTITQKEKDVWKFAYEPITKMMGDPPTDGTNWLMIAHASFMKAPPLRFDEKKENELGRGGYGAVYRGTFEGNAVAVKVHLGDAIKQEQKREMEAHRRLCHENVLKLLQVDDSRDKTCLVLELCAGTLTDYCEKKYNGPELPPDGIVLYQIANGLHYIHSRNLVHRDIKPDNILISMTTPIQMKLSDFGFVKKTSPQETFTQQSGLKGTLNWMAPEILELMDDTITEYPHGSIQSDTFAAGCVFFYFLTRGKHPFGNSVKVPGNILQNKPENLTELVRQINFPDLQGDDRALYELIGKMIKPKEDRIAMPEVIKQLATNLIESRQFKRVRRFVGGDWLGKCFARFHPTKVVIACGVKNIIIFFSAENSSIPFSNWKEKENKKRFSIRHLKEITAMELNVIPIRHLKEITAMEWNADGTQLAAIFNKEVIVCWSYPSGAVLFHEKLNGETNGIEWNPFRPNVFAAFDLGRGQVVSFFNSCPDKQRQFHFCTIKRNERYEEIHTVQWISENRVALGLDEDGGIQIWEIDESTKSAQIVKRFKHERGSIEDMAWDERTKSLAACSYGWMTIWSMDSDQPIHALQMVNGRCESFAWRPNGKQTDDAGVDAARKSADNFILAGGLNKGRIVVWTPLAKEKTIRILSQHSRSVDSLSFSPDGRFLASAERYGKLIIWSTENWEPVYIGEEKESFGPFSWSSATTDVPDYKLTFTSSLQSARVIEYAVGQI